MEDQAKQTLLILFASLRAVVPTMGVRHHSRGCEKCPS